MTNGGDLVVGQLSKDNGAALGLRSRFPVNTLAFNCLEESALLKMFWGYPQSLVDNEVNAIEIASTMMTYREMEKNNKEENAGEESAEATEAPVEGEDAQDEAGDEASDAIEEEDGEESAEGL